MHMCGICVGVCVFTVVAARQCMHVSECVFGLVQGACSL